MPKASNNATQALNMWMNTSSSNQEIYEDGSSHSSQQEKSENFGGYVDKDGTPNPRFVSNTTAPKKDSHMPDHERSTSSENEQKNSNQQQHASPIHDDDDSISPTPAQQIRNERRLRLWIDFFSDLSFFFGAFLYFWLALREDNAHHPNDNNTTIENSTTMFKDEMVSNDDSMVFGIIASLLMLAAGSLRLHTANTPSDRVPYAFMVFAAFLALVSSSLRDNGSSNVCDSISVHWYALQAATLVLWRASSKENDNQTKKAVCVLRLLGDTLFLAATMAGIALSYLHLFEANDVFEVSHSHLATTTASLWWTASILYLAQSITCLVSERRAFRQNQQQLEEEGYMGDEESGIKITNETKNDEVQSLPQDDTESTGEDDEEKSNFEAELLPNKVEKSDDDPPPKRISVAEALLQSNSSNEDDNNIVDEECQTNDYPEDEDKSLFTLWTAGPGPAKKEDIAKSSLDHIFDDKKVPFDEEENINNDYPEDEDKSLFTLWTAGPGPAKNEDISRSSLDNIFGRS